jgi:hypothetical protein
LTGLLLDGSNGLAATFGWVLGPAEESLEVSDETLGPFDVKPVASAARAGALREGLRDVDLPGSVQEQGSEPLLVAVGEDAVLIPPQDEGRCGDPAELSCMVLVEEAGRLCFQTAAGTLRLSETAVSMKDRGTSLPGQKVRVWNPSTNTGSTGSSRCCTDSLRASTASFPAAVAAPPMRIRRSIREGSSTATL